MQGFAPLARTILFVAALAGIGAGSVGAALHLVSTVPLILKAEAYEEGAAPDAALAETAAAHTHAGTDAAGAHQHAGTDAAAAGHDHGAGAWEPTPGLERNGLTLLFTLLTGFGFALLLVAASELAGGLASWRQGIGWGLAGFAVFTLAPGLGLPPELPAMPAAELMDRQIWWSVTALATALGLACLAFGPRPLHAALGVLLIAAPHLVGAPQPASYESPIPEGLHHSFVVASILASFVFWVLLGGLAGWLRPIVARHQAEPAARPA
ncbi:CbtA family protein [Ancylobacter lacus]|uniref:CbtA family protein n=1 Tax=Ancylobacter lacus TaxID=2579970 RepID=UPI001BCF599C|nr:CbtA family protein [Ancylobacter lacus]MBS7537859.1 CbtA family protein [Ancylobacter lacus]